VTDDTEENHDAKLQLMHGLKQRLEARKDRKRR